MRSFAEILVYAAEILCPIPESFCAEVTAVMKLVEQGSSAVRRQYLFGPLGIRSVQKRMSRQYRDGTLDRPQACTSSAALFLRCQGS